MPGAATNYLELKLLDHALGTASYTKPTNVWVGLFTDGSTPADTGPTSEVSTSGSAYIRQQATFSSASAGSASTSATITFPTATANWGTITYIAIFDAQSAGNMLFYGPVVTAKVIETNDTFQITSGNLTVSLD